MDADRRRLREPSEAVGVSRRVPGTRHRSVRLGRVLGRHSRPERRCVGDQEILI